MGTNCSKYGEEIHSALKAILFLLYVNDLAYPDIQGKPTLFTDEITLLWLCTDSKSLYTNLLG